MSTEPLNTLAVSLLLGYILYIPSSLNESFRLTYDKIDFKNRRRGDLLVQLEPDGSNKHIVIYKGKDETGTEKIIHASGEKGDIKDSNLYFFSGNCFRPKAFSYIGTDKTTRMPMWPNRDGTVAGDLMDEIQSADNINENYYGDINEETLENGILKGYVQGLDDKYSRYLTEEEYLTELNENSGTLVGLGLTLSEDESGYIRISEILSSSPAAETGLLQDDLIINIDGIPFYLTHGHLINKYAHIFENNYLISGHTHIYNLSGKHLNPGSVGLPRMNKEHTCIIYDNHLFKLINLEDFSTIEEVSLNEE